MRLRQFVTWLFVGLLPAAAQMTPPANSPGPVVLRDVRLLDGTGVAPRDHMTLVLAGGKILRICSAHQGCPVPAGAAENNDVRGMTVMPGLISGHAHLALLNGQGQFDASQYTEPNVLAQLQLYQRYGVTTVVSLGANRDLVWSVRDRQRDGELGGATLLTVGRGIGVPGGFPPFPAAPDQLDRPSTPEEARADVDRAAEHKADLVKVWIDSNHGKLPEMSDNIAQAVIAEAHTKGLRVAAHVYALEDARRLVNEGVDILAHSVRDKPVDPAFVELLRTRRVWYIPTLTVDESFFVFADHPELLNDPLLTAALPPSQLQLMQSSAYRNKIESDSATAQHRQDFAIASRNLRTLYDAGVAIGFGTDSGAALGRVPGYSEHRELSLMVQAGLKPLEALGCATGRNAEMLHLNSGVILPGKTADLLVLRSDPSKDITAVNGIVAVYQGGVRVSPAPPSQ